MGWLPHRKCYPLPLGSAGAADGETAQHGNTTGADRRRTGAVRRRVAGREGQDPQRRRPFDGVREEVRGWLVDDPSLLATEILARLQERYPGRFPSEQKRTLQREVKAWRADAATRLILQGATALGVPAAEPMDVASLLRGSDERQACLGNIAG